MKEHGFAPLARRAATAAAVTALTALIAGLPAPPAASATSTVPTPSSAVGNDVSYPQCSSTLPAGQAFGIVGVDDGIANKANPCLGPELAWAQGSTGLATSSYGTDQVASQLYVNTADPGNSYNGSAIADWPANNNGGGSDPYGLCKTTSVKLSRHKTATLGQNSPACAWQYGWNLATQDANTFLAEAVSGTTLDPNPGDYPWWLDVETGNTWQSSSTTNGIAMNDAVLEGMATMFASLKSANSSAPLVGVYSTSSQWSTITGGESTVDSNWSTLTTSGTGAAPLDGVPDWVPGATAQTGADSTCTSNAAFTSGAAHANVTVAQWTANGLDSDVSC